MEIINKLSKERHPLWDIRLIVKEELTQHEFENIHKLSESPQDIPVCFICEKVITVYGVIGYPGLYFKHENTMTLGSYAVFICTECHGKREMTCLILV